MRVNLLSFDISLNSGTAISMVTADIMYEVFIHLSSMTLDNVKRERQFFNRIKNHIRHIIYLLYYHILSYVNFSFLKDSHLFQSEFGNLNLLGLQTQTLDLRVKN